MGLMTDIIYQSRHLYWWQWGKIVGVFLPILLTYLSLALGVNHVLLWAIAAHLFVDFSAQTNLTATRKAQGDAYVLGYHAFIAGGYPGFIVAGLPGLFISVLVHFLVDSTRKFGLEEPLGPIFDIIAHLTTVVTIWLLFYP